MALLRLVFWNVSNLFEPKVMNRAPQSHEELDAKVDTVCQVINDLFGLGEGPDLIGLAEVHTERILQKVIAKLNGDFTYYWANYGRKDQTGLALIGRKGVITQIDFLEEDRPTIQRRPRSILLEVSIQGIREPLIVAVVHWNSRMYDHAKSGSTQKLQSARWLGDLLAQQFHDRMIVVMGDFNAEPFEACFNDLGLKGSRFFPTVKTRKFALYNTAWRFLMEPSFCEDNHDQVHPEPRAKTSLASSVPVIFDQILVSRKLIKDGPVQLREKGIRYYYKAPVGALDTNGVWHPDNWKYNDDDGSCSGASDHFPLCAVLQY